MLGLPPPVPPVPLLPPMAYEPKLLLLSAGCMDDDGGAIGIPTETEAFTLALGAGQLFHRVSKSISDSPPLSVSMLLDGIPADPMPPRDTLLPSGLGCCCKVTGGIMVEDIEEDIGETIEPMTGRWSRCCSGPPS